MRLRHLMLTFAAVALAACGQAQPGASAPIGDQVRAYILEHPEIVEEAINKLQEKRQVAADTQLRQNLAQNRKAMEQDARDFVTGNPNGKITVVEFFDYRCPYCKSALPEIEKLVATNKDVRLVLKEFPILSPASDAAARAAIGAKAQGKYWPVHMALMNAKQIDDATIQQILIQNGVDVTRALRDGTSAAATAQIEETKALARQTGVNGTPAFIIGDKLVAEFVPDDIQKAIADARKAG